MPRTCLLRPKSLPTSLLHSPFLALRRCVSPPAGCGGSLRATRSAGSCRDAWHANMPTSSTRPPAPTSSPARHALALMLCLACCALPSILMPMPRSSHIGWPQCLQHHLSRRIPAQAARGRPSSRAVRPPVVRPGVHVLTVGRFWRPTSRRRLREGDALAPALYALGQHDALVAADERLQPGECLAAFLDDVCIRCDHARSRAGSARRRHYVDPGPGRRCR